MSACSRYPEVEAKEEVEVEVEVEVEGKDSITPQAGKENQIRRAVTVQYILRVSRAEG